MVGLIAALLALGAIVGAVRRGGVALGLALAVSFWTLFGDGPPNGDDWFAAGFLGVFVFAAVRVAQSYARERPPSVLRERLAGRPVYRAAGQASVVPRRSTSGRDYAAERERQERELARVDAEVRRLEAELGWPPGVGFGAAGAARARRAECERRE